ncbi:MAG: proline--tRNA ligase [Deltaproteobacteria bacterium]|nr:MAG: proline--tRNA ligase [Deltaproteobacteria bacterium]
MKEFAITPQKQSNFSQWYLEIIKEADLAEHSPVRGCMIIKPHGYGIWEKIQEILDKKLKETDHENVYFPLLIPLKFIEKESNHIKGFAKECAVVTHHKLKNIDGKLVPDSPLEEPFIIRPTSETIIGNFYSSCVKSYRDLPIKINQWSNVMRWELRPRLFLRTSEFLWQEGHTIHETQFEAKAHTQTMLDLYSNFIENYLAIPVFKGLKTPDERFPGALETYCLEAQMQDGKALQAATSHFLGQNFSKAFNISFLNRNGQKEFAWTTSWGISTRLIGAIIMSHSDNNGLILPPLIAPKQVVLIPILKQKNLNDKIISLCKKIKTILLEHSISSFIDQKDENGGEKVWKNIKKGIPVRIEIGPIELQKHNVSVSCRTWDPLKKIELPIVRLPDNILLLLKNIQKDLFQNALSRTIKQTISIYSLNDFHNFFSNNAGFAISFWHPNANNHPLFAKYKVSIRCILLSSQHEGICPFSKQKTYNKILIAKAY